MLRLCLQKMNPLTVILTTGLYKNDIPSGTPLFVTMKKGLVEKGISPYIKAVHTPQDMQLIYRVLG